jgi:hypothetical protein
LDGWAGKNLMQWLRDLSYTRACAWLVHWPLLALGVLVFHVTGKTPWPSYWAMRRLYCITHGRSNQMLARLLAKPSTVADEPGVLRRMEAAQLKSCVATLERDGFVVLGPLLSAAECDELISFALATHGTLVPTPSSSPALAQFDPVAPKAVRYELPERRVAQHPIVQRLLADASLRQLASHYLACEPVNDLIAMWWSAPGAGPANSEAAQLYHFDMDRPQFLKIFIYLTDVTPDTGPHCFIRASHRDRPAGLWRDGRHDDRVILSQHGSSREVQITGARGTAMAVDTSGFHKGKPLKSGHRLILQLEYTCALFGHSYQTLRVPANDFWREQLSAHPRYYARFSLADDAGSSPA